MFVRHRDNRPHFSSAIAALVAATATLTSVPDVRADVHLPSPETQNAAITAWWDTLTSTEYVTYACGFGGICVLSCGQGVCWRPPSVIQDPSGLGVGYSGGNLTGYFDGTFGHVFLVGFGVSPRGQYTGLNTASNPNQPSYDLYEYWMDTAGTWRVNDLSVQSGASTTPFTLILPGGDNVYTTVASANAGSANQHVFYFGQSDGRVHEAYFNGSRWADRFVTGSISNDIPELGMGLTSYQDVENGSTVFHVFVQGQEYYLEPGWTSWPAGVNTGLSGFVVGATAGTALPSQSVIGSGPDWPNGGGATMWFWQNTWNVIDVGPLPNYDLSNAGYNPTSAYYDGSHFRMLYVGTNQHIYQMLPYEGFGPEDITQETGAVLAALGDDDAVSPIAGFFDGNDDHVFYIGTDQHVHEMYKGNFTVAQGGWALNDPSASTTDVTRLPSMP